MDWHMCDQALAGPGAQASCMKPVACMPMVSRGVALEDSLDLGTPAHHLASPATSCPAPVTFWFCILGQCLSQKTLNTEAQSPLPGSSKPHIAQLPQLRDSLWLVHFCLSFPRAQPLVSPLDRDPLVLLLLFLLLLFKFSLLLTASYLHCFLLCALI